MVENKISKASSPMSVQSVTGGIGRLTEIRKDYLLDQWTIIASERSKRPTDFLASPPSKTETKGCPFCPGNERMTPPAFLLYLPSEKGIQSGRDTDGERPKDWLVRGIPNLYAALSPREPTALAEDELHIRRDGVGSHEVIVESPCHDEHPSTARLQQIELVLQAYMDRTKDLSQWEYVSIFRNHRKEAGASLSHAHSQIIATPMVPKRISDELDACMASFHKSGFCPFCETIKSERKGPRFIFENQSFIAFAPWASVFPLEFWLFPKRHQSTLLQLRENEKIDFARALRICFGGLATLLNDPPYSFGFHMAPTKGKHEYFHWHLEVYPKLTIQAGFENSTGMFINITPPEMAAESLAKSAEEAQRNLSNA